MISIKRPSTNRLDIEIAGKITGPEMKRALTELFEQAGDIQQGRMLYRVRDISLPGFNAVAVELKQLPRLFRLIRHFDRVALLADQAWVRKAGELEGMLFPGLEIKAFEYDDSEAAEFWLAE